MRWFVEVSPLGKAEAPSETHCVEAAQWQKALAEVRKHAGHDETLRNFSIEVLDDGVRAVDPTVRLRYLLKRAPNDAPVTIGQASTPANTPSVAPSTPPPSMAVSAPAPAGRRPLAQTMMFGSPGAVSFRQTLARGSSPQTESVPTEPTAPPAPPVASVPSAPPPAVESTPLPATQPSTPPAPPVASVPSAPPPAVESNPLAATQPSTPPPKPRSGSVPPGPSSLPAYRVLTERSQEPTDASPITYREMAFALLRDATEATAEQFIRGQFEQVRKELVLAPPGKLVNLAVFDHVFDKKPLRPPLVTLVWKDWKNPEPEVRFPTRPGSSMPPPSLGVPSRPPQALAAQSAPAPAPPSPSIPMVPKAAPSQPASPVSAPASLRDDIPTPASTPIAIRRGTPKPSAAAAVPAPTGPTTVPLGSAPPASAASAPSPARMEPSPVVSAPAPSGGPAPQQRVRKPTPAGGMDVVADLFEVMHDLHFLRDVAAGSEFVLSLALEKLQSQYGIVQIYDINRREFVVVRAAGPQAASTVGGRTAERDPLLTEVMQRHMPFVVDFAADPRIRVGRWAALGAEPALVLAAAVAQSGRFLGVLEVGCAPGRTYVKQHLDGMAYIADAFSEFLVARGILFSGDVSPIR